MGNKRSSNEPRREARESFMQLLYEMEIHRDYSRDRKDHFLEQLDGLRQFSQSEEDGNPRFSKHPIETDYIDRMYDAVVEHLAEIDQKLTEASSNWKLERIARVDLAVLRLSIAEIWYISDIPNSVSINEAVELAKKFGTEDSGKFVNGILGKVVKGRDEESN
jgi:N utilization substance protein B